MIDVVTKGERAQQIIDNDVYKEAVAGATKRIKDQWAAATNADDRESLWHKLQAIEAVTTELKIIRDCGIVESRKNEQEKT